MIGDKTKEALSVTFLKLERANQFFIVKFRFEINQQTSGPFEIISQFLIFLLTYRITAIIKISWICLEERIQGEHMCAIQLRNSADGWDQSCFSMCHLHGRKTNSTNEQKNK